MADSATQQNSHARSILCVDDDVDTCEMLEVLLHEYEITSAHAHAQAIRSIESKDFDMYIFDNWMPGGTGIELCRKVRSLGIDKPILFVSGATQKQEVQEALASGATRYLIKPCEPTLLREIVKELIS